MNMGVFRIHDRNTLYEIGDLKYNGKYFFKCGASLAVRTGHLHTGKCIYWKYVVVAQR